MFISIVCDGIELAKNLFALHGADEYGKAALSSSWSSDLSAVREEDVVTHPAL